MSTVEIVRQALKLIEEADRLQTEARVRLEPAHRQEVGKVLLTTCRRYAPALISLARRSCPPSNPIAGRASPVYCRNSASLRTPSVSGKARPMAECTRRGKTEIYDQASNQSSGLGAALPVAIRCPKGNILPVQVLKSAAGFYLGTLQNGAPFSRESERYWGTAEEAAYAAARQSR